MKILVVSCLVLINITIGVSSVAQQTDAVKKATASNDKKVDESMVNAEVADFLVKAADARMMGIKEGELAVKKGTSEDIRKYGQLMIKDQNLMLTKIKRLAAKRKITLPSSISNDKQDGYSDLAKKNGKAFDKKFCKMMIIDHKRDIKDFTSAIEYKDKGVHAFATTGLPLIKSHLEKIEAIEGK